MIQQSVLPIKLKRSNEKITARSGLLLFAEFMNVLGVERALDVHMPAPGSGRGFQAVSYATPIIITLYGGGATIEDIREMRPDKALRKAIGMKRVPSSSATGDWLKRMGERGGIEGVEKVNDKIVKEVLRRNKGNNYTLIVDPTMIEAAKSEAKMTYLGFKGYRPVAAVIKELDLVIAYEFKEGNDSGGKLAILQKAFAKMPAGKRIKRVLLDSEYYTNEVMEFLSGQGVKWAICANKDAAVKAAISAIPDADWKPFIDRHGDKSDREVASTVHSTNEGKEAFSLVVIRWKNAQGDLFDGAFNYHCIATNMGGSAADTVLAYNGRSCVENNIKELKHGFGLDYLPTGDFHANAVWFGLGVMAYNLFVAQKLLTMPESWRTKTIKSVRWMFINVAGKVVEHSRKVYLKLAVGVEKYEQYLYVRRRTYALSLK